jgi:hypothetical protein
VRVIVLAVSLAIGYAKFMMIYALDADQSISVYQDVSQMKVQTFLYPPYLLGFKFIRS